LEIISEREGTREHMRKRRMPEEKLANLVSSVDFQTTSELWMPRLERCFHQVLMHEYYLKGIPDNLALPRYRKIVIRIIYRLLSQVHSSRLEFSKDLKFPDPLIDQFMEYLVQAEIKRKQKILHQNPITRQKIRSTLLKLKSEMEI
jgi:hypothetical protein